VVCLYIYIYILMIFHSYQGTVTFKLYAAAVMYVCSQVIFFLFCYSAVFLWKVDSCYCREFNLLASELYF
jgi:hypothetical protein